MKEINACHIFYTFLEKNGIINVIHIMQQQAGGRTTIITYAVHFKQSDWITTLVQFSPYCMVCCEISLYRPEAVL